MKTPPLTTQSVALLLLLPLLAIPPTSGAQALPAAVASPISTGFSLPSSAGTLQYALSASQSISSNYFGNSAEFWLGLQMDHDLWVATINEQHDPPPAKVKPRAQAA